MTKRLDTRGHPATVEYRSKVGRYFVLYETLGVELAPAFVSDTTAYEIAVNAFRGVPFFTMIPTVPIGTCYPRPNVMMPKEIPVRVTLRTR